MAAVLLSAGCGGESGNVFSPPPYPELRVNARLVKVEVRDVRRKVDAERQFDIPLVVTTCCGEIREIAMAPETEQTLGRRMRKLFGGGSDELVATIRIVEGYAGWQDGTMTIDAFARARVEVSVQDARTGRLLLRVKGEGHGKRGRGQIREQTPDEFFQAAVIAAFDDAMARESTLPALALALRDPRRSGGGPLSGKPGDRGSQQVQVHGVEDADAAAVDASGEIGPVVLDAGVTDEELATE